MGSPSSLLGQARAFARDFPRDRMPPGYLWDVVDFVPTMIDANLTGRGGWRWGSDALGSDPESGVYMPYAAGDKLLVQTVGGRLLEVDPNTLAVADRGALPRARQNPVQLVDAAIHFDTAGAMTPRLITAPGGAVAIGGLNGAHKNAPVGTVYKAMVVSGGAPGEEAAVRFSVPNADLTTAASFDVNSFYPTSRRVTGLAALRAVVLVFHPGSVERMRGAIPAHGTNEGDITLEALFDRAGCVDPQTICYWNDNCVFADEHGVHLTDGAVIRNLVSQGGILYYWRPLYSAKLSMSACTFLDYYIVTVRRTDGISVTLICDLTKRQWFRFTNLPALCYIASSGGFAMERVWAGLAGKGRLARIGPCFFPDFTGGSISDDDGSAVLPTFETPWYRFGQEGRKRVRFAYLSYDVRVGSIGRRDQVGSGWRSEFGDDDGVHIPPPTPDMMAALAPVLELGFIRSPQDVNYVSAGQLPATTEYRRFRLPVGKFPYGMGFRVRTLQGANVVRVFDLGVEQQAAERSRV